MHIALVSQFAAKDMRAWSGIPHSVLRALHNAGAEVTDVSPLHTPFPRLHHAGHLGTKRLTGVGSRYEFAPYVQSAYGRQVTRACQAAGVDAILSLGTVGIAQVQGTWPMACWCDATVHDLATVYDEFSRLRPRQRSAAENAERVAMKRCVVSAFASPWAARSAAERYGLAAERVMILPFGANVPGLASDDALTAVVRARQAAPIELLWIGSEWKRKRGRFCVEATANLRDRGVGARLNMVGATPDDGLELPDWVTHRGYVDKNRPEGRAMFETLLTRSSFTFLPSRAECFGIAIAEGNAYGLPALGADIGGIPGALTHERNGELLPADARASDYADVLHGYVSAPERYELLARRSYGEWRERLNWDASIDSLLTRLV